MMKRVALALGLALVPATAMAQTAEAAHKDHAKMMGQEMSHEAFVQSVIAKRAELELTDEQVTKLTVLKTKLADHAKMMKAHEKPMKQEMQEMKEMKHEGKAMAHGDPAMAELHKEFMAIFTDAQKAKVDALMKAHAGHAEGKMKH